MHWARLSEEVNPTTEETELYDIKFKDDYETLLQKLEAGMRLEQDIGYQ